MAGMASTDSRVLTPLAMLQRRCYLGDAGFAPRYKDSPRPFGQGLLVPLSGNDKGHRGNKMHQWLTEDVGDPMLAQHLS
jgi:hypothetical protein